MADKLIALTEDMRIFFTKILAYSHRIYKLAILEANKNALVAPSVKEDTEIFSQEILERFEDSIYGFVYNTFSSVSLISDEDEKEIVLADYAMDNDRFTVKTVIYDRYKAYCKKNDMAISKQKSFYESLQKYEFDLTKFKQIRPSFVLRGVGDKIITDVKTFNIRYRVIIVKAATRKSNTRRKGYFGTLAPPVKEITKLF
jgi:phage/plasmid-associated DNA primase